METEPTANDFKEAGNKKFQAKNFQAAIQDYSKAIGMSFVIVATSHRSRPGSLLCHLLWK
jgi:hypothetical protein